jgi:hypothetical protein
MVNEDKIRQDIVFRVEKIVKTNNQTPKPRAYVTLIGRRICTLGPVLLERLHNMPDI